MPGAGGAATSYYSSAGAAAVSLAATPVGTNSDQITLSGDNLTAGALCLTFSTNFSTTTPSVPTTSGFTFTSVITYNGDGIAGRVSQGIISGGWGGLIDGDGTRIAAAVLLNATTIGDAVAVTAQGSGASFPFPTITPTGTKFLWRFYYGAQNLTIPVPASATAVHDCYAGGGSRISFAYQSSSSGWTAANGSPLDYDFMGSTGGSAS